MWEGLKQKVSEYQKKDTANVRTYFIIEALKGFGHSPLLGGQEAADYLHNMGMDDQTIVKMQRKYFNDPYGVRTSLEQSIFEGLH